MNSFTFCCGAAEELNSSFLKAAFMVAVKSHIKCLFLFPSMFPAELFCHQQGRKFNSHKYNKTNCRPSRGHNSQFTENNFFIYISEKTFIQGCGSSPDLK